MKEFYTLEELAAMSMLTTRTLRNYLRLGLLSGTKTDGVWQFTAEDFENFLQQKSVRQSIAAKRNSVIYDFLLDDRKLVDASCQIYDFAARDAASAQRLNQAFTEQINHSGFIGLQYAYQYDGKNKRVRVFLRGEAQDLLTLVTHALEAAEEPAHAGPEP